MLPTVLTEDICRRPTASLAEESVDLDVFNYFTTSAEALLCAEMETALLSMAFNAVIDVSNTVHGVYEPYRPLTAATLPSGVMQWTLK